jgi:hypothetical protein
MQQDQFGLGWALWKRKMGSRQEAVVLMACLVALIGDVTLPMMSPPICLVGEVL